MDKIRTRMGSGFPVEMSESELMQDLTGGSEDAADRGKIPPLSEEELKYLFDLFSSTDRFLSVESGKEIVLSYDASPLKIIRAAVNVHRIQSLQIYEKLLGADTLELGHVDYSFKPVKPIVGTEQTVLEQTLMVTHPRFFMAPCPNLGLYSQPDGPFPNPSELMPLGKIAEARDAFEMAVEDAIKDIVYVSGAMYESGADGINMDTTGAAGDADFLAALRATEILKQNIRIYALSLAWPVSSSSDYTVNWSTTASDWQGCMPMIR